MSGNPKVQNQVSMGNVIGHTGQATPISPMSEWRHKVLS